MSSIMDLCMKEFAMQQKLGLEFHLQQQNQHQFLMSSPPFSPFHFGPSPADIPSSSSSSFFGAQNQQQQILFDKKSTFVQECPPPSLFDPFAAAVAANFMQHFSRPKGFVPAAPLAQMPILNGMGGWPQGEGAQQKANIPPSSSSSFPHAAFGFGFSLPESPSCISLNSTGSCASLDSFASSGLPSSPDSSSNSSLQNGPPFPLIGPSLRKFHQNQQNAAGIWQQTESALAAGAIGKRSLAVATDFSELAEWAQAKRANGGAAQMQRKQQKIVRHENGQKMMPPISSITVQHAPQLLQKKNNSPIIINSSMMKKKRSLAEKNQPKLEHQRRPSIFSALPKNNKIKSTLALEEQPPKKVARKLGTTIFVPLEMGAGGIGGKKTTIGGMGPNNRMGNESMQPPTLIPVELAKMEENVGNGFKGTMEEEMEMERKEQLKKKEEGKGAVNEAGGKIDGKGPFGGQAAPLLEVNLSRLKCEFIELEEKEQFGQQNAQQKEAEATFLLADSPPILTLEKENGGAKKEAAKRRKANLGEKKKMTRKMEEKRKVEIEGEIKAKKVEGGEVEKMEELKLSESSSSSSSPFEALEGGNEEAKIEELEKKKEEKAIIEEEEEEEEGEIEEEEKEGEGEGQREKRVPCRWTKCRERFEDDDQLYDHITTAHVELLKKWVLAEQRELEQQRKAGLKRRRSSGGGAASTAKERFRCRWRKCEQFPRRGDAQKKLDWLLKHLVIRHAPKARPFCCIFAGCPLRFPKLEALRDHLRTAHDDTNGRGNGRKGGGGTGSGGGEDGRTKINCFEFRARVHLPIVRDCIDARTVEWIRSRLNEEEFAPSLGDEPKMLTNLDGNSANKMERAKARKMRNGGNSPREGSNDELGGKGLGGEIKEKDGPNNEHLSARMSMHETINHLKGLFHKMSSRR